MAVNPTSTQLDPSQAFRRCYSEAEDAIRTIPSSATSFEIELSAADGDNITAIPSLLSVSASITSASTGVVVPATACTGIKSVALYIKTDTTIVGPQVCTLEVSPADSGDVWAATTSTITPSTTAGVVVLTAPIAIAARRLRVSIAAAITSGTATLYVVGQSN